MKKIIFITILLVVILLTGCVVDTPPTVQLPDMDQTDTNILIAYFTWADNTVVEDPSSVDETVRTSASVLAPGNATIVATYIQEAVGGTLFSMKVEVPYSSDYYECLDRASDEKATSARPKIVNTVENFDQYEIIFLGYPNWWSTVPMAIYTFLESYDFSNKTIIPFCVHGTSGIASSARDIQRSLSSEVTFINNPFGVYRPNTRSSQPLVNEWLIELGFEVNE